jgi:hypothetical protein
MSPSPYLTSEEAAAYVRKTLKGFNHWVTSRGVSPDGMAGRIRLYLAHSLDRVLQNDARRPRRRRVTAHGSEQSVRNAVST